MTRTFTLTCPERPDAEWRLTLDMGISDARRHFAAWYKVPVESVTWRWSS
jgi:hypothetical protein